mgnify:CR=1 FL=1
MFRERVAVGLHTYRSVDMTHQQLLELLKLNSPNQQKSLSLLDQLSAKPHVNLSKASNLCGALNDITKKTEDQ